MISYKHKFLIIMPPKTGSVSISNSFKKYCNIDFYIEQEEDNFDFIDIGIPTKNSPYRYAKHHQLKNYKDVVQLDRYFKIGCIRNPYARVVSFWKWQNKIRKLQGAPSSIRFYDWLKKFQHNHWPTQTYLDYFSIDNKTYNMDYYIKLEDIENNLNFLFKKFDLKKPDLYKSNTSKAYDYRFYYNNKSRDIVEELFRKDIDYFNYQF